MTTFRPLRKDRLALCIGAAAAVLHFWLAVYLGHTPSEGSWQWFPLFAIDFPFSVVLLAVFEPTTHPLLVFGLLGSLWWFILALLLTHALRWLKRVGTEA